MATLDTLVAFDALASRAPQSSAAQLNLRNGHVVLAFDDSTDESADFLGVLPINYSGGGVDVLITWAAAIADAGVVRWSVAFERHAIGDTTHGTLDLNVDDFATAVAITSVAPSAAGAILKTAVSLTPSQLEDLVAGESFRVRLARQANDAADTLSGDAELLLLEVREA